MFSSPFLLTSRKDLKPSSPGLMQKLPEGLLLSRSAFPYRRLLDNAGNEIIATTFSHQATDHYCGEEGEKNPVVWTHPLQAVLLPSQKKVPQPLQDRVTPFLWIGLCCHLVGGGGAEHSQICEIFRYGQGRGICTR